MEGGARFVASLDQLFKVNLSGNRIGDNGVEAIATGACQLVDITLGRFASYLD